MKQKLFLHHSKISSKEYQLQINMIIRDKIEIKNLHMEKDKLNKLKVQLTYKNN